MSKTCRGCKILKKCKKAGLFTNVRCLLYEKKYVSLAKILTKENDDMWAKIIKIKAGGKCELCQSTNRCGAHHIELRVNWGTRWVLENGIYLCFYHHFKVAHHDAMKFNRMIKDIRDLDKLLLMKNNKPEKEAINIYLRNELKKLHEQGC